MEQASLKTAILNLELQLLEPEVRQSAEKIAELLSDDFIEFCSSGKVYHYKEGDTFGYNENSVSLPWEIIDFSIKLLTSDVVLATYKVIKHNEVDAKKYSLRSSIWSRFNDKWKMLFHQGTLMHEI